jgi:hypothetical protein
VTRRSQLFDLLPVQPGTSASVTPAGFRLLDAVPLPLLDKTPLHLGHHAEDGDDDVAYLAARRNMRVEDGHECSALLALMDQVEHIAGIAAEPIKAVIIAAPATEPWPSLTSHSNKVAPERNTLRSVFGEKFDNPTGVFLPFRQYAGTGGI